MVSRIRSMFDYYEFTEEEEQIAKKLGELNILYLCNLRHEVVVAKLNLKFDPTQPHVFQQNEAMLTGKIDVLTLLIGD